jgi:hypothetical protein
MDCAWPGVQERGPGNGSILIARMLGKSALPMDNLPIPDVSDEPP